MYEANIAANAAQYLSKIRTDGPRIHCLTNNVVQNQTANMLLSVGAHPSMSADIDEITDFTTSANALLINLGTLDTQRKSSIRSAILTANSHNIPWILDPVLVNRASKRLDFAKELLNHNPTAIRGNKAEINALASSPQDLARQTGAIVVTTGVDDLITDGQQTTNITNGHPLMSHVTGMGCSGTAILAAFISVAEDNFKAVVAAISTYGEAGSVVGKKALGPGSFEPSFIDQLYQFSITAGAS